MIKKSTKQSIDNKMSYIENSKYFVYKQIQNSNSDKNSPSEITNYTLENYNWIKDVFNEIINFEFNPYIQFSDRERLTNKYDNHLADNKYNNRVISSEVMLQRHLSCNNDIYNEYFGNIIDYECNVPMEPKKASIDLLSYELDEKNNINFIIGELKVCDIDYIDPTDKDDPVKKKIDRHTNEAKDLLLRAILEAAFYGLYFHYALINKSNNLLNYLRNLIKEDVSDDDIRNAKIKYYIIAPKNIINQCKFECFKDFDLSKFSFYSIEQNKKEFEKVGHVIDCKKYFNIEKVN